MTLCQGIVTALITPFDNFGEVDYKSLTKIIEKQIDSGIQFVGPCGTTGESPTLHPEERRQIVSLCAQICKNTSTQVIAGAGSNSTAESIQLAQDAEQSGADMLLVVTPYYNKPSQEGMIQHYTQIHDSCSIPICIYNIPGRTSIDLQDDNIVHLANQLSRIQALKDATGDLSRLRNLQQHQHDLCMLTGSEEICFEYLTQGGHGVYSVISNLLPREMIAMYQHIKQSNISEAQKIFQQIKPFIDAMSLEVNPVVIKCAMYLAGYCTSYDMRLPLMKANDKTYNMLQELLQHKEE